MEGECVLESEGLPESRNIEGERLLWAHPETFECAKQMCIPCFYKLCPPCYRDAFSLPPNQRPEMCPRSSPTKCKSDRIAGDAIGLYKPDQRILTIGDGDFSFSLSLAKSMLHNARSQLVATSYESEESVRTVYPSAGPILDTLHQMGVTVLHEVDASALSSNFTLHQNTNSFDVVIWNFPCVRPAGTCKGADGQVSEIEENKTLLRAFFRDVRAYLRLPGQSGFGGEVHITHKTIEPFSWWGLPDLAHESGLAYLGSVAFDRCLYPGYINRKVLDKKSFPATDAETFIFRAPPEKGCEVVHDPECIVRCRLQVLGTSTGSRISKELSDLIKKISKKARQASTSGALNPSSQNSKKSRFS